ncbi:MAG: GYD domain-containing protein [Actinobacteria bacterium]|nr:GYD domain-containing protein [Actinomycetota bacterium]
MAIYILLTTLTAQGVQTLRSNPDRLRQVNADVEELGARVLHQWATLGPYDFLNVVEAPDDGTIAKVSIALGARGSAKLQTMPAMTIDDFLKALE